MEAPRDAEPARILIVDDHEDNVELLRARLESWGYTAETASNGAEALSKVEHAPPDLILLDVMMPKRDGLEVCRLLKSDPALPFMPIILVTAKGDPRDIVAGLECGGDEYLTKPVDHAALVARVKSILRIKALHDQVQEQAKQLTEWNQTLERRVAEQLNELQRMSRLKRFLSPQIAESVVREADDRLLESHRSDVAIVFCDLRGFTGLAESAEPEEVMEVLREYHSVLGAIIHRYEGTLERFLGDGLMVLFNDPVPCPDPAVRAVKMSVAMRDRVIEMAERWHKRGYDLGFGIGIAQGYATLGRIGFEGRFDYAAIGSVPNLASRICNEAKSGQILISQRVSSAVEHVAAMESLGMVSLKGLARPIPLYNVLNIEG